MKIKVHLKSKSYGVYHELNLSLELMLKLEVENEVFDRVSGMIM